MPVKVKNIAGVPRIVEAATGRIARSKNGVPVDGGRAHARERGGHAAYRQVAHINAALEGKRV